MGEATNSLTFVSHCLMKAKSVFDSLVVKFGENNFHKYIITDGSGGWKCMRSVL